MEKPQTFFVSTRTSEGKALLQTDRMATLFIDVLRSYMQAGKFKVHDFVVMRNHVYLLLTIDGDMTLENAMQLIKGNFSFRARKEFGLRGAIWQQGFSDVRVTSKRNFLAHQEEIYGKPVKTGLAKSAEEYPFCSAYFKKLKRASASAQ